MELVGSRRGRSVVKTVIRLSSMPLRCVTIRLQRKSSEASHRGSRRRGGGSKVEGERPGSEGGTMSSFNQTTGKREAGGGGRREAQEAGRGQSGFESCSSTCKLGDLARVPWPLRLPRNWQEDHLAGPSLGSTPSAPTRALSCQLAKPAYARLIFTVPELLWILCQSGPGSLTPSPVWLYNSRV